MPVARSIESRTGSARGVLTRARAIQCPSARLAPRVEADLNSGQPSRTHVHAVAAERHALGVEQAALALALGERPVGADDAVPGHVGVVAGGEHGAREARRAGRDVAVGADEARRGVADAGEDASRCGSPGYRRASCATGPTRSSPSTRPRGEHGAAVHSHWFSVGSLCIWARPGVGAVATQSVVEPAHGPHGLDRLAAGRPRRDALDALLGADALAAVRQVGDRRRGRPGRRPHRRGLHPVRGRRHRRARLGPGQHDGPGHGAGRDGRGLRGGRGRPRRSGCMAALDAAEGEGGDVRGRQSAALVVVPRDGRALAGALRPAGRGPRATRSRSCGALLTLARAYELAGEADELMASDRAGEAGPLYERAAALAPESARAAVLGRASPRSTRATPSAGIAAVRRAIEIHPGWRDAARPALAGLRPRGGARPARAGLAASRSPAGGTRSGSGPRRRGRWRPRRRPGPRASGRWWRRRRRGVRALRDVAVERHDVGVACRRRDVARGRPAAAHERARAVDHGGLEVGRGGEVGRLPAVDLVGVEAGRRAGGVGGERRAGGVARPRSGPPPCRRSSNSNARPPLRLLARMHGSAPGLERQP